MKRRHFFKMMGVGAASLGISAPLVYSISKTKHGELIRAPQDYGGFVVERLDDGRLPYAIEPKTIKPFSWKKNVFGRNDWDPTRADRPRPDMIQKRLIDGKGKIPNQSRLNYALSRASWNMARPRHGDPYLWDSSPIVKRFDRDAMGPWDPADIEMNWSEATLAVKHAGMFFGASLAGAARANPLWFYNPAFSPTADDPGREVPILNEGDRLERTERAWYVPRSLNRVLVLAFEEDFWGIANSPGQLASAAVGDGYSRMAVTASTLAEFIRGLGYLALPAGNEVGLSIPMAIDAGLGEIGRNGLLITPKYGPRVRLAKVLTDMPLEPDRPIAFGVTEFCESCMLCADECPSKSIPKGSRDWKGNSVSNNPGAFKWYIEPESCYDFNDFSCSNCKRVCPFTKPNNSWLHKIVRTVIDRRVTALNTAMVKLDQAGNYGQQVQDTEFWSQDGSKTITGRESM